MNALGDQLVFMVFGRMEDRILRRRRMPIRRRHPLHRIFRRLEFLDQALGHVRLRPAIDAGLGNGGVIAQQAQPGDYLGGGETGLADDDDLVVARQALEVLRRSPLAELDMMRALDMALFVGFAAADVEQIDILIPLLVGKLRRQLVPPEAVGDVLTLLKGSRAQNAQRPAGKYLMQQLVDRLGESAAILTGFPDFPGMMPGWSCDSFTYSLFLNR